MVEPKDIVERQVVEVLPSKSGLLSLMEKRKVRLYLGVDPTGSNLHLGHAIALRKLQQFADLGHEAILVVGTGTVLAGDPSQRDTMRPKITEKEIKENIKTWKKQVGKVINFRKVKLVENGTWLKKLSLPEMLRIASQVSSVQLFHRDMFQKRIEKGDTVWTHELLYPLLQGYDSVALNTDVEIGGTDQTFNMLIGRELVRKMQNREKFVLILPMLQGLDGRIMSKTSGNTVNLMDEPNDMFGKLMTLRDELVMQYFELCTDVSKKEVGALQQQLSPRDLKAKLAQTITTLYHGEKAATAAKEEFEKVFKGKELPTDIPEVNISEKEIELTELLVQLALASSKGEARRLVEQGGVKIAGEVQKDWNQRIPVQKGMVVQVGPRRFVRVS
ncbi:MAG: tyrosine--tRNA ligase [bacterium]|nr:tyrosine--tRNA ligase [bacterium]